MSHSKVLYLALLFDFKIFSCTPVTISCQRGQGETTLSISFFLYRETVFNLVKDILRWPCRACIDCVYFTLGKHQFTFNIVHTVETKSEQKGSN